MAVLFRDVVARTRMLLDEVSPKSWTDSEVYREDNIGYQKTVAMVVTAYEDFYLSNTTFDLVTSQQEYGISDGLPSNIFKVRRIELCYRPPTNTSSGWQKALPINITQIRDTLSNSGRGSSSAPLYYVYGFDSSFKLGMVPIPNQDVTGGARLWYVPTVDNLVNLTDVVNIPYADRFSDAIALEAAGMLLRKGQQEEVVAARYLADAEGLRNQMQEQLKTRVADDMKVIIDSMGADLDFSIPF